MPISFSSIPEHIQLSIIAKLSLEDFFHFHTSSRDCYNVARKIRIRFAVDVGHLIVTYRPQGWAFIFRHRNNCLYNVLAEDIGKVPIRIQAKSAVIWELGEKRIRDLKNFLTNTNSSFSSVRFAGKGAYWKHWAFPLKAANIQELSYGKQFRWMFSDFLK